MIFSQCLHLTLHSLLIFIVPLPFYFLPPQPFLKYNLPKTIISIEKTSIIPYLRATAYLNYVEGHISPPPKTLLTTLENSSESSPNTVYIQWLAINQLILSTLIYTHHEFIIPIIVGINLLILYGTHFNKDFPHNPKHVIQLHLQLNTLKKGSQTIFEYYQKEKIWINTLIASCNHIIR